MPDLHIAYLPAQNTPQRKANYQTFFIILLSSADFLREDAQKEVSTLVFGECRRYNDVGSRWQTKTTGHLTGVDESRRSCHCGVVFKEIQVQQTLMWVF